MSAPLLATRDTLVGVLAAHLLYGDPDNGDGDYECGCGAKPPADAWEEDFGEERWHRVHVADALAGVVRDPATLADDEALVERVNFAGPRQLFSGTAPEEIRDVLTNLAAALTEDPS